MKYVEYVNGLIKEAVSVPSHPVLFGQNINAGSCLSGLTRGLSVKEPGVIWNSTNAENSLVGFGFGIMMAGGQAGFFMKQMDFLLLGMDQLVNTYNIIRSIEHQPKEGSFTIVSVVVDSGYEGPQSSLNNFADFCSMARIPGFAVTNKVDAEFLIKKHLMQPGFRMLGISQRLEKAELLDPGVPTKIYEEGGMFRYKDGSDATVVCFNFSFPYGAALIDKLETHALHTSLFNVNAMSPINWKPIIENVRITKKLIIIDDSKSVNVPYYSLLAAARKAVPSIYDMVIGRKLGDDWLHPVSDAMEIDYNEIINQIKNQ